MASISPFNGTLTRDQAAHLLRRATFGPSKTEIDTFTGMNSDAAVDLLFSGPITTPSLPIDPATGSSFAHREEHSSSTLPNMLRAYMRAWWIKQMYFDGVSAQEKMVYFLHTHFTTSAVKVGQGFPLYHQNELFRQFAFGNFKTLARKICRDYAMSVFLDSYTNSVISPNENFARELLELFTIGKGQQIGPGDYTTYTEDDVRAAARVLTGYFPSGYLSNAQIPPELPVITDPDTGLYMSGIFIPYHDSLPKVFSQAFQNAVITSGSNTIPEIEAELEALINMIFNQQATAEFICRKLYRFFVYYEITAEVETDIIQPLATTMIANSYELLPVVKQLIKSEHFFDADDAIDLNNTKGAIIKSPIELIITTSRYFNVEVPDESDLLNHYGTLLFFDAVSNFADMQLFQPPEVAGWPSYHQAPFYNRNWVNATTLLNRYSAFEIFVRGFFVNNGLHTVRLDILDYVQNSGNITTPADPNNIVDELSSDLLPYGIDAAKKEILKLNLTDGDIDTYWTTTWVDYLSGGNENTVRVRLEALVDDILQSPEYQLQ